MEVTKLSKPSMTKGRVSDSASKQAVTRVNAEQAPKRVMWEPTRLSNGEGRRREVQVSRPKRERREATGFAVPPG